MTGGLDEKQKIIFDGMSWKVKQPSWKSVGKRNGWEDYNFAVLCEEKLDFGRKLLCFM